MGLVLRHFRDRRSRSNEETVIDSPGPDWYRVDVRGYSPRYAHSPNVNSSTLSCPPYTVVSPEVDNTLSLYGRNATAVQQNEYGRDPIQEFSMHLPSPSNVLLESLLLPQTTSLAEALAFPSSLQRHMNTRIPTYLPEHHQGGEQLAAFSENSPTYQSLRLQTLLRKILNPDEDNNS